jgi:hypothetical protein
MSKDYISTSLYFAEMRQAIDAFRGAGEFAFTQHQLAAAMGRKITASMRNALEVAESIGLIIKFRYITERGGIGVAYEIVRTLETVETMERPF